MALLRQSSPKPLHGLGSRAIHKEFDLLELPAFGSGGILLRRASETDIEQVSAAARSKIGALASVDTIKTVARFNPDNIHVIASQKAAQPLGCFAQIMLRKAGLDALHEGRFDGLLPRAAHCAREGERPAAIYVWAVVAPGRAALGITLMSQFLRGVRYRSCDLYTVPATQDGKRIIISLGYQAVEKDAASSLFHYRRLANHDLTEAA